ncbi:MAG: hypothetical protein HKN16_12215 [Saprospiraceae bacterium]|nr:hypothetical protein [Saprospiraceae bacterium]
MKKLARFIATLIVVISVSFSTQAQTPSTAKVGVNKGMKKFQYSTASMLPSYSINGKAKQDVKAKSGLRNHNNERVKTPFVSSKTKGKSHMGSDSRNRSLIFQLLHLRNKRHLSNSKASRMAN